MSKLEEKRKQRESNLKGDKKKSLKILFSLLIPFILGFNMDMLFGGGKMRDWWYVKFQSDVPSFTVYGLLIGFVLMFIISIKNKKMK